MFPTLQVFLTKVLDAFGIPAIHDTHHICLILLDLMIRIVVAVGEGNKF
jgi:hypothetical protein